MGFCPGPVIDLDDVVRMGWRVQSSRLLRHTSRIRALSEEPLWTGRGVMAVLGDHLLMADAMEFGWFVAKTAAAGLWRMTADRLRRAWGRLAGATR